LGFLKAKIKLFDFLPSPGSGPQEFQTGFDAGFVDETFDVNLLPKPLPAVNLDQFGEDVFQREAVQGVVGLGMRHDRLLFCCFVNRSHAGALKVVDKSRQAKSAVIPAGMQESSAMDGNLPLCKCLIQATGQPADSPPCDWIPAVHAGMTGFNHLCITVSAGAWEREKGESIA
jgi:hypothetical protein